MKEEEKHDLEHLTSLIPHPGAITCVWMGVCCVQVHVCVGVPVCIRMFARGRQQVIMSGVPQVLATFLEIMSHTNQALAKADSAGRPVSPRDELASQSTGIISACCYTVAFLFGFWGSNLGPGS